MKRKTPINFEATLNELETLVEQLERGDISLEESLKQFEHGIQLVRSCQQSLQAAEQKVQMLTRDRTGDTLEDFVTAPDPTDDA